MARVRTTRSRQVVHAKVINAIHEFVDEHGYPPSYREVAAKVGTSHSNVWYAVDQLRQAGYVGHHLDRSGLARALTLTPRGKRLFGRGL